MAWRLPVLVVPRPWGPEDRSAAPEVRSRSAGPLARLEKPERVEKPALALRAGSSSPVVLVVKRARAGSSSPVVLVVKRARAASPEVVCTESTTQCAVPDADTNAVTNGTCYDRECKGYLYSESYSTFQSGPPCPTDLEQALGSACEPEGTECFSSSHQDECIPADSSNCYSDLCEVYPDGGNFCQPACKTYSVFSNSRYTCVSGGLCQECGGGGCGTTVSCSGGLWQLVSHSCWA